MHAGKTIIVYTAYKSCNIPKKAENWKIEEKKNGQKMRDTIESIERNCW